MVGLYAAFIVGLITSFFGGRPGMISGATAAGAVVLASLVVDHGVEYLFAAVALIGVLQLLAGVLHLGKYVRLIPHPVILGFVNGVAEEATFMAGTSLYVMIAMVFATMAITYILPKLTKAVPASLIAIVTVTLATIGLSALNLHHSRTVMDFVIMNDPSITSLKGGLPSFHIPLLYPYSSSGSHRVPSHSYPG